ncbi:MAG: heavy metal translocating P-type ATPase [Firmicutes bacterium]|nr:heavy metal translocating P-type ATPase [Bacillota bacterium]MDY6173487.1 heavy metal translocating P-type ATPase [Lentihominibacter sp.]
MERYTVRGMSCAACSARVEKAVTAVKGVTDCSVSLLTNSMGVEGTADAEEIIAAVRRAGYDAEQKNRAGSRTNSNTGRRAASKADNPADNNTNSTANISGGSLYEEDALKDRETPVLIRRLAASAGFLAVLMYISMGHMMWGWPLPASLENNHVAMGLLQLLLTGAIMVINQKFFISGFKSLWNRAPNMDALVAMGASAAFCYSTFALFQMTDAQVSGDMDGVMSYMHEFYFESAAMILALITLGKMLEARSKGKTTDALKGLMKLAPETATLQREKGEVTVPVEQVVKGDIFLVRPGESIPVDGIVLEGNSAVDESTLTGESIPVNKEAGSTVSAGTLNRSGFIRCEATRVGEDTTLSQIIQMVSDAAATKAPIAKAADKVAGIFVPAVMVIAAITFGAWIIAGQTAGFALARGISVLVISCPCALGLATPVAIMVGSGVGAKNGILFKTAAALEMTGRTKIVALDKTGTITRGEPKVTDIIPIKGKSEEELLSAAFALERKSEHPLAGAIVSRAEQEGIEAGEIEEFKALPGNGVTAVMDGTPLLGGSCRFVSEQISVPREMTAEADRLSKEGKTPLFFGRKDELLGIIAVADTIKEDSPRGIEELQSMGINVVMLTGDNPVTAEAIGKQAGVDEVIAGVLPGDKERVIRELMAKGVVAMAGDGVNDAPALTRANVGIAIGSGSDVAIDAADVVLMKDRLSDIPAAIRLSRATLRNIHQNLFWAFIYNVIGIPLAAGAFIGLLGWQLNPMFAAAAMSLSSFCVVTNALRLNLFKMHDPEVNKNEKEIKTMEKTLNIEGMMCVHCEMHVRKALEALDGVKEVSVSHETGKAVVTSENPISDDELTKAVEKQGYQVKNIK